MSLHKTLSPPPSGSNLPEIDDPFAPTCTIFFIRRHLGCLSYGGTRLTRYITLLIEQQQFPAPYPVMRGKRLDHAVTMDSNWPRDAVIAWLDDYLPPANEAAVEGKKRQQAANEMDHAAQRLKPMRLVKGGRA